MNNNSVILRPATIADMDEVTRIQESACAHSDKLRGSVFIPEWNPDRWEGWKSYFNHLAARKESDPLMSFQMAVQNGSATGFIVTRSPDRDMKVPTGQIDSLYVAPDAWGQGIGKRLLASASEFLAGQGCVWGILWTEYNNKVSEPFYQRQGWTRCGESVVRHASIPYEGMIMYEKKLG